MEYLQYLAIGEDKDKLIKSFKPYYKWNTFNTTTCSSYSMNITFVLNLIINGIPSILKLKSS